MNPLGDIKRFILRALFRLNGVPWPDPLLDDASVLGCTVQFRPQSGYTRYREYRLFRRRPCQRLRKPVPNVPSR